MSTDPARVTYPAAHGLTLVGDAFGDPAAAPVLLLHGGGQTRHAWGDAGRALAAQGFYAVALDQRGHGESDWDTGRRYELDDFALDLSALLDSMARPPAVVGASLGGIAGLLAHGHMGNNGIAALVLVDVAHRMEPDGVQRVVSFMRAHLDTGFASVEEAAAAISAYLPHRDRPTDVSGLAKNLRRTEDGRFIWHWDPEFVAPRDRDRERGGTSELAARLRAAAQAISVPTLLIRGRRSDVLSEDSAREFVELVPHAEYVDIRDAAHMVAGDRNDHFTGAVVDFLARTLR